jgi:uncharacterized protein (TIGR00645 family)
MRNIRTILSRVIYAARWILFPVNAALIVALLGYVAALLINDYQFFIHHFTLDMEILMVQLLGFVDAAMVANLIIMIAQGSHQIFITKFEIDKVERAQWLDHIDSGILKVKIAMSVAGITLIQVLKDIINENSIWTVTEHRIVIHVVALMSALVLALIWRVTHPAWAAEHHEEHH